MIKLRIDTEIYIQYGYETKICVNMSPKFI